VVSLSKAQRLAAKGRIEEAEAYLSPALAETSDVRAWLVLGQMLEQQGKPESALEILDKARSRFPDHAPAHLFYGIVALDLGRGGETEAALSQVLALQPENDVARSYIALCWLKQGKDDAALSLLREHGINDNRAFRVRLTEWMESQWLDSGRFFAHRTVVLPAEPPPAKSNSRRAQKHFYAKRYPQVLWELDSATRAEQADDSVLFACAIAA
jgi:tetratricopeptide (TPR) repeat protein